MNDPSVLFHIDLTLTVAMVTENGRQNRLIEKMSFLAKIRRFKSPVHIQYRQIPPKKDINMDDQ